MKIHKTIALLVSLFLMTSMMTGCAKETVQTEAYEEITTINIITGGNDVNILSSDDDKVSYEIAAQDAPTVELSDGALTITIPLPDSGVNLSAPNPLTVKIPQTGCPTVTVESVGGTVSVTQVTIDSLSISTQHGDVATAGIYGKASIQSDLGEVNVNIDSTGMETGEHGIGASLDGYVGRDDDSKHLTITTSSGTISVE